MTVAPRGKEAKATIFDDDISKEALAHYLSKAFITVDTETRGLNIARDRLCVVQISDDEMTTSLVRYRDRTRLPARSDTNLKTLLEASQVLKVFHYARFDLAVLRHYLHARVKPVFCTKIASKLVRTYTDRHSLKDLCRELLGTEMDKSDQTSDWAREDLTDSQLEYAANDVRLLVPIYLKIKNMVAREGLEDLVERCCNFVDTVCELDLQGRHNIFDH